WPVTGSDVLVRYTLTGDANLDGRVNALDFNALASNFGGSGSLWVDGDFNYDGKVNALDFNAVATNFGQTLGTAPLASVVPEPASVLALLAYMGLRRRQRSVQ